MLYFVQEILQFGHGGRAHPAIWFRYELSPITVKYTERRKPLYHFLTTVSIALIKIIGYTFKGCNSGIFLSCFLIEIKS